MVVWENNIEIEKMHYFMSSAKFLGFILINDGHKPDTDRIKAMNDMNSPTNKKET